MVVVAQRTKYVTGLPRSRGGGGDPSPITSLGVEAAIRACFEFRFGTRDLTGRSVAVVGVGRVGSRLAGRLSRAGARVILADIDESKCSLAAELPGARWADPNVALQAEADVLAPCALGGEINESNVARLRCQIICGSANNQLAHDGLADDLAAHGILYAPDFVANAGGLINIAVELEGYDGARARAAAIEQTMARLLEDAARAGVTPLAAAYELARRRLAEAARPRQSSEAR